MKRLLAIAIASVLLLSACGRNESIPFSDLMSREIKVVCAEDRIGYKDFEAYLQVLKDSVELAECSWVLVRMQPLERMQYMVFRTDDSHLYMEGYTTTWVKILEVYEQIGEAEITPGEKISFRQEYYLQPQTEEDMEEMFLSLGGRIEEDARGIRIGRIEDGAYEFFPSEGTAYDLMIYPNTIPLDENREYYAYICLQEGKASLSKVVPTETYDLHSIEEYRDLPLDSDIEMVMKEMFERAKAAEEK
ncbi:MAG: hypothetical protein IJW34_00430 [Clostridia bacterium]|nr:hypothetical protein [Clostridia bacterium]